MRERAIGCWGVGSWAEKEEQLSMGGGRNPRDLLQENFGLL